MGVGGGAPNRMNGHAVTCAPSALRSGLATGSGDHRLGGDFLHWDGGQYAAERESLVRGPILEA